MSEQFDSEKPLFRFIDDGEGGEEKEYFPIEDMEKVWNGEDLKKSDGEDEHGDR